MSKRFPIFHSEDDFKFKLEWLIKETYPHVDVSLERKILPNASDRTDLAISTSEYLVPIEPKYKTLKADVIVNNERYLLKYQGARDYARYDFLIDIVRIEALISNISNITEGYVILITMDQSIMKVAKDGTLSSLFPIHQGNTIHGDYSYNERENEMYMSRSTLLTINGHYEIAWYEYSKIDISGQFIPLYCLIVNVLKADLIE